MGVIYVIILNLLRVERFKKKNVILVGFIFDMKLELFINIFIDFLVEELK